jgi:hypothetical protein
MRQEPSAGSSRATAPRRRLTRLASLIALPVIAATVVAPATQASAEATAPAAAEAAAATARPVLPFDLPAKSVLQASPRKVFANWVTSMPISMDNKPPSSDYYQRNYLTTSGEGGKHAAYGGLLRDRPLGRAPLTGNWRLEDMKTEVRQALSSGIDGFTMVIYTLPAAGTSDRLWDNAKLMMQAAAAVDPKFKIIPMVDTSGWSKLRFASPDLMARRMAELAKYPAAYKIDGKAVLTPFTAENLSPAWWSGMMKTMATKYGAPSAFFPLLQNEIKWRAAFAPITYGMANWGVRNPKWNNPSLTGATSPVGRIGKIHELGDKWMAPVSVQDSRPRNGLYWEAENTQNLRNSWEIARKGKSDWAQLTTWNDLPEHSSFLPSQAHGWTFLDINAYYLSWFKTGQAPTITRDAVYLTHRKHALAAKTTFKQTLLMKHGGGAPGRDKVEALTFAKAAGSVQVVVGGQVTTCAVKPGVNVCTVPLRPGKVSAKVIRGGATVASLTSPYTVTATPQVQDFQYVGSSSLRQGGATAPAPSTPAPEGSATTVTPVADGYGHQAAATTSYGSSSSLVGQGGSSSATSYLRFNLPAAPAGKTLLGATLKVRTTDAAGAGSASAHTVKVAGNGWTEAGLTWNNRPAVTGATLGSLTGAKSDTAYSTGLSATALRPSLGKQVTIAVTGTGTDGLWFWSRNHVAPSYRPQLVLNFG